MPPLGNRGGLDSLPGTMYSVAANYPLEILPNSTGFIDLNALPT